MQQFMDVHNIVLLSQRGNLSCSPEKERQIEMNTAYHLGVFQRGFQSRIFDENLMENLDETHFTVNMDNGRTLGFRGDTVVKYADVIAGGDTMTMVIRILGGRRSMVEAPMLIFTNGSSNYPFRGLEDTIPGVCYRTGPKGWLDQALFSQYFEEPRAYQPNLYNRIKTIWVDNCMGLNITPRLAMVLAEKITTLRYLPLCATYLCQRRTPSSFQKSKMHGQRGGKLRNLNSFNKILGKIGLEVMANGPTNLLTRKRNSFFNWL
jgi:hypothetical protein